MMVGAADVGGIAPHTTLGEITMRVLIAVTATCVAVAASTVTTAAADVFNGRIAFSSFRADPAARTGDIFTINADGSGLRQLTTNPADDAQSDWSPDGRDIAYRIRKPDSRVNFEVARMTASGDAIQRLTDTPLGQASSQPSWFPDRSAILFRRSGPGRVSSIWRMGLLGESPLLFRDPPGAQFYPSLSADMSSILFATTMSATGDTDRAIQAMNVDSTAVVTLFDEPGAFDSAPAWSPDRTRIAFQSNADIAGANPERDSEIWLMDVDGANPTQITHNADHDEGPDWSPDGTMLAYSSGVDNNHLNINVMTAGGTHLRQLTDYDGRDESPDWQTIPAPATDRRCGDLATSGAGARDVRAAGNGLSCEVALKLAARWSQSTQAADGPQQIQGFTAQTEDFGGVQRAVLTHRGNRNDGNDKLVAFLYQP